MNGTHSNSPELDPELVRVGATIKHFREARGMSQEQLANASMLSRPYIANVEAGRKKASMKAVARISTALAVPQIALIAAPELSAA